MTTRLRAGIIGGGFMGEVHARSIRIADGVLDGFVADAPVLIGDATPRP